MIAMFEFQNASWRIIYWIFPNKIPDQKPQIERKDRISPFFGNSASVAWCNKSSCKSKRCITAAWCFLVVSGSATNSERSARVVRSKCEFTRFLQHMQQPKLRGGFANQTYNATYNIYNLNKKLLHHVQGYHGKPSWNPNFYTTGFMKFPKYGNKNPC